MEKVAVEREHLDEVVMDYFITQGYQEAAKLFAEEAQYSPEFDLDTLSARSQIRSAIQAGKITEAVELLNQLNPEILEKNEMLAFQLRQQQLIELIRAGETDTALQYAADNLAEQASTKPELLKELEETMSLLCFENPAESPLDFLLWDTQREAVADMANAAVLYAERLPESGFS